MATRLHCIKQHVKREIICLFSLFDEPEVRASGRFLRFLQLGSCAAHCAVVRCVVNRRGFYFFVRVIYNQWWFGLKKKERKTASDLQPGSSRTLRQLPHKVNQAHILCTAERWSTTRESQASAKNTISSRDHAVAQTELGTPGEKKNNKKPRGWGDPKCNVCIYNLACITV